MHIDREHILKKIAHHLSYHLRFHGSNDVSLGEEGRSELEINAWHDLRCDMFETIGGKLWEIILDLEKTLSDHLLHSLLSHQNVFRFDLTKHTRIRVSIVFKEVSTEWEG